MYNLFMFIVVFHFLEHVIQIAQVYFLHMSRHTAGGILGYFFPELMHTESLHFGYALFMFLGILYYYTPWGKERYWWRVSLCIQTWHLLEHILLFAQASSGTYIFGRSEPTSVLQLFFPKIELHFFYNVLVMIPLLMAVYYRSRCDNRLQNNIRRNRSVK